MYEDINLDVKMIKANIAKMWPPSVLDVLLAEFMEEAAAWTLGIDQMHAFFRNCFRDQGYYLTKLGTREHELWDFIDTETVGMHAN